MYFLFIRLVKLSENCKKSLSIAFAGTVMNCFHVFINLDNTFPFRIFPNVLSFDRIAFEGENMETYKTPNIVYILVYQGIMLLQF